MWCAMPQSLKNTALKEQLSLKMAEPVTWTRHSNCYNIIIITFYCTCKSLQCRAGLLPPAKSKPLPYKSLLEGTCSSVRPIEFLAKENLLYCSCLCYFGTDFILIYRPIVIFCVYNGIIWGSQCSLFYNSYCTWTHTNVFSLLPFIRTDSVISISSHFSPCDSHHICGRDWIGAHRREHVHQFICCRSKFDNHSAMRWKICKGDLYLEGIQRDIS